MGEGGREVQKPDLQASSDWAMSFEKYNTKQWIIYSIFCLFPVSLGLIVHILIHFSNMPLPELPPHLPDYVGQAIPGFVILITLEFVIYWIQGGLHNYRLNDSISSTFMGMIEL